MNFPRLISTDFDGTLIGFGGDGRCSPALADCLLTHHQRGGKWALNTGRSLEHAVEGLTRFRAPIEPDFLLTLERDVHRRDHSSVWEAYGEWNQRCRVHHDELFLSASDLLTMIEKLAERLSGVTVIFEKRRPVGFVTQTESIMDELTSQIDGLVDGTTFAYQRNSIYLRFCHRDYHKGSALGELCRLEGFKPDEVFAIGDHFNDIPMLDGRYAALAACPANAINPVKDRVRLSRGYVSDYAYAEGVADALNFYFNSAVLDAEGAGA